MQGNLTQQLRRTLLHCYSVPRRWTPYSSSGRGWCSFVTQRLTCLLPPPKYVFPDSLNPVIDCFSVQFGLPKFDIYRVICGVLEEDGRVTEAIELFQQMQLELGEDMSIHDERAQWELGEHCRDQCNQRLTEHGTQVFNCDAQRGWRSSATLRWILRATTKQPDTSRLYCHSTRGTG